MFLQNKYTKIYHNIISFAQQRSHVNTGEKHHIIPKSFGGADDEGNLVMLTPREHFVCHLLLIRMTEGLNKQKMVYAATMMSRTRNIKINSRTYQSLREQHATLVSKRKKGRTFADMSPAEQDKMRAMWEKRRGSKLSKASILQREQTKNKRGTRVLPINHKGRKRSDDTKRKQQNLRWFNNGTRNIKIDKDTTPPDGFIPGRCGCARAS